ncbi:MAG: heavy metal-responsive transcriptional regulator [Actinobacteria bacterium]|nr:heavy metal-responsive transcriptional regulator [Actinomycetota bacterium]
MRIGELAGRLGLNTKTIRYYEQIGLVPAAPRTSSGYRDYTESDASRLVFIKSAQRLGLSLGEISEILSLRDQGRAPCGYVRDVIAEQLRTVDTRIAELLALRGELRELHATAAQMPELQGATCRIIEHARASAATS